MLDKSKADVHQHFPHPALTTALCLCVCVSVSVCVQVNVLDKSKADWQQMKAGDATIEEELESHR